jgi:hypothetical protein
MKHPWQQFPYLKRSNPKNQESWFFYLLYRSMDNAFLSNRVITQEVDKPAGAAPASWLRNRKEIFKIKKTMDIEAFYYNVSSELSKRFPFFNPIV